jgi:hypothetical protein
MTLTDISNVDAKKMSQTHAFSSIKITNHWALLLTKVTLNHDPIAEESFKVGFYI